MLSLSIKISDLAIYDIIYISKACTLVCFVYSCVWVYRNSRTTQHHSCTWTPTLEISSVSSVRTTTRHTKLLVITLASLPGSVDYR